jgi:dTDP-4-dehydrorhamnose reductase
MMNRALVIGADGHIGNALYHELQRRGVAVVGTSRRESSSFRYLDLARIDQNSIINEPFSVVYICSGVGSVQACEDNPYDTRRVNVTGVLEIARPLHASGALIVFISTAMVFGGVTPLADEQCEPTPTTEYGRQKVEAERELSALGDGIAIVRVSKVISARTHPIASWIQTLREGGSIEAHANRTISPVALSQMLELLVYIGTKRTTGIVHLSGTEDLSFYDFIKLYAPHDRVHPVYPHGVSLLPTTMCMKKLISEYAMQPYTPQQVVACELPPLAAS